MSPLPSTSTSSNARDRETESGEESTDTEVQSQSEPQDITPSRIKKRRFTHNFKDEWLKVFPWVEKHDDKAFCKCCQTLIVGGITHLKRHNKSTKHIKKYRSAETTIKLDNFVSNKKKTFL